MIKASYFYLGIFSVIETSRVALFRVVFAQTLKCMPRKKITNFNRFYFFPTSFHCFEKGIKLYYFFCY